MFNLMKRKTDLASVLSSFEHTLGQLADFVQESGEELKTNNETIYDLRKANDLLLADTARAQRIYNNISVLIGGSNE